MTIRPLEEKDLPVLEGIYNEQQLAFADGFPKNLEFPFVVVDEQDRPFMLTGVKMVPELIMICDQKPHVTVRLKAIALMHLALREKLPSGAFAFVAPCFSGSFIRTMSKRFGWKKTWEGYRVT